MSLHVTSWVLKNSPARLGERLVLIVLAEHAASDGNEAYPSVETIAREARLSERQVQRCLRDLEGDGMIRATGTSRHGTTIWQVVMGGRQNDTPDKSDHEGVTTATVVVSEMSPKPSLEPSKGTERTSSSLGASEDAARLCQLLVETVNSRGLPGKKVTATNDSIDAIDKLNRIDGVPWEQIERMILFLDQSSSETAQFWRTVVRSGKKLRQHFAEIVDRARVEKSRKNRRRDGMTDDEHRAAVLAGAKRVDELKGR